MRFKNKATQKGFYEWWNHDYITKFTSNYRNDENVKWLLSLAFEAGIQMALVTIQEGLSPLTTTTTERLE